MKPTAPANSDVDAVTFRLEKPNCRLESTHTTRLAGLLIMWFKLNLGPDF